MTKANKYTPKPRKYEQKDWLYQQYWGEFKSTYEIADMVDVSADAIKRRLRTFGIPRRSVGGKPDDNASAFSGFYKDDENARMDPKTEITVNEFEETDPRKLTWQKHARDDDSISDNAVIKDWTPPEERDDPTPEYAITENPGEEE